MTAALAPMEARSAADLPQGDGWWFEPKWDGFRCLARREGEAVELQAKSGKPLARYFPEIVETVRAIRGLGPQVVLFTQEADVVAWAAERLAGSRHRLVALDRPAVPA